MTDLAALYRSVREELVELAGTLTDDDWTTMSPACPEWTVRDIYGHLVGIAVDTVAGNVAGSGTDEWTAAQVEANKDATVEELLATWNTTAPSLEAMIEAAGGRMRAITIDLWSHGQDIRNAAGRIGGRGGDGMYLSAGAVLVGRRRVTEAGLPTLRVVADPYEFVVGEADPEVTLTVDTYELSRATMGRRSPEQMRSWDWSADPDPYLTLITAFPPRETPLVE